ncbi:MAG: hypothetical protein BEN18_04280 [Epulopiscium sp. Nuni2H_MBin001]|nr:MAG: hypothetical protein BEN18_04280 [Epulopiscium sp. Nuni2H_MBin001]
MKIGIIGLGLIGGSIAKSLKTVHSQHSYIVAYDTNVSSLSHALNQGIINKISYKIGSEFSDCNVIFVCTPVSHTVSIVKALLKHVDDDCIITDVGSTKSKVINEVYEIIEQEDKKVYFVGGHPMAGSEKSGYIASTNYLFENAYYILTPYSTTPDFIVFILQKLVERLGAIAIVIPASYHDFATATISHVPHIVASALVQLVKSSDTNHLHTLAAGGFKDITRIASSNPAMWQSICLSNKDEIAKVLTDFIHILISFKDDLENSKADNMYDFFLNAKSYRDTFREGVQSAFVKVFALFVDVRDQPGCIATIATLLSHDEINIKDIGIVNQREFDAGILRISFSNHHDRVKAHELLIKSNYIVYY